VSLDDLEDLLQSKVDHPAGLPVVVVIDDDAGIRSSLETVLKAKYDVRTCADALQGVRAVDKNTSCVILDVRMPTHDGFWVCKHLRRRAPDVPIIFFSAYQDVKDPYEIINEFHPFGYVVKGDTLSALLRLVASAIKHSERLHGGRQTLERLRAAREQVRGVHESAPPAPSRRTDGPPPPPRRTDGPPPPPRRTDGPPPPPRRTDRPPK
jgi:DNA-binding NtrC family response regulator